MKFSKWTSIKGILLAALILFWLPLFLQPKASSAPFENVVQSAMAGLDLGSYPQKDVQSIKALLKTDPSSYENIAFFRTDDGLNASELVIAKFSSSQSAQEFASKMEERRSAQENMYAGYAPEAEKLMKDAQIIVMGNYGIYVSGNEAPAFVSQFEKAVKEGV